MKKSILPFLLLFLSTSLFGQINDLDLGNTYSSSISLRVKEGQNLYFGINTFSEYANGSADPSNYRAVFTVKANVDFRVSLAATDMRSPNGDILDIHNFGFKLRSVGTHKPGRNFKMFGTTNNPSSMQILGEEQEIIRSDGKGNAGSQKENRFELRFELGTQRVRNISGLPSLLEQDIVPGNYSGTLTLIATAMP